MATGTVVQELINAIVFERDEQSVQQSKADIEAMRSLASSAAQTISSLVGGAIIGTTREFAASADQSIKTARNLGLTAEAYQELTFAAGLSGVQQERLADGLKDLQKTSVEATRGNKELAKDYRRLGINAREFVKIPADQKLMRIAEGLQRIENPAERAQVKMRVLGESGVHMGNLLDNGSAAIAGMRKEARDLGLVIGSDVAVKAEAMNDALDRMEMVVKALTNPIAEEMIPVLTDAANATVAWVRTLDRDEIRAVAKDIAGTLKVSFDSVLSVMNFLRDNAELLRVALVFIASGAVIANLGKLLVIVRGIAAAMSIANASFLLGAVALGAIVLIVDDFIAFLEGRPSIIGDLIGDPKEIEVYRRAFETFFKSIQDGSILEGKPITDWIVGQAKESHKLGVAALTPFFKETADMYVRWEESFTLDEFSKNLKRDLDGAMKHWTWFYTEVYKVGKKGTELLGNFITEYWKGIIGFIMRQFNRVRDLITSLPGADRLLSGARRVNRAVGDTARSGISAVAQLVGGGASSPAQDQAARIARVSNTSASNTSISVGDVNVTVPDGAGTPQEVGSAVRGGMMDAIAAERRRARERFDGAME